MTLTIIYSFFVELFQYHHQLSLLKSFFCRFSRNSNYSIQQGALLTQGNIVNSPYLATKVVEKTHALAKPCNGVPFFHIYGFSVGIIIPLMFDSMNILPFYFPDTMWSMKAIQTYKCNTLRGAPTQFIDLLNHSDRKKYDLSSLKNAVIAGSTVNPDLLKQMHNELQIEDVFVGYGLSISDHFIL